MYRFVLKMSFLVVFIIFAFLEPSQSRSIGMRQKIEVDSVQPCPSNDQLESPYRNMKMTRYNDTIKLLSYDLTYLRPFDDKVGMSIGVEKWDESMKSWTSIPFLPYQSDMCRKMLKYFKTVWVETQKASGVEHPDKCPIPPGNYSLRNFVLPLSSITIPHFNGKFKVTSVASRQDTRIDVMCTEIIVVVSAID